ncbi:uncharacterized protein [Dysidea avara]|uniref:uncharacterized protein n=1 Tax=Dysidea avara TaxID=196820 RepID=UPI00331FDFDC
MSIPQANLDAIKEAQKKAVTAYKDQDYNTILKLHTEDCTMIPPGSAPVKGRAALKEIAEEFSKSGVVELKTSKEELHPMGECYILDTCETQLIDKDNKVMDTMNSAVIWHKDDDGVWRIMFEMDNSQTPQQLEGI